MSRENVEAVYIAYAAFNEGDLAGVLSWFHPDAVYRDAIHQAVEGEAGAFRGHDGIRQWWRDLHDHYEHVIVVFVVRGRGKGSGIALDTPLAQVVKMRQGKVIELRDYFSREQALEAVG